VLQRIPDSDGVQQLLNHMIEEDADRRAQESADYLRDGQYGDGNWEDGGGWDDEHGDEGHPGDGGRRHTRVWRRTGPV
jgi:hypothetical protein